MMETNWGSLQRIMEIAELRSKGIQDTHFLDWTFQIAEDNPYVQMAKRYVDQWEQAKAENLGLLFWGGCGNRKILPRRLHCKRTSFSGRSRSYDKFPPYPDPNG